MVSNYMKIVHASKKRDPKTMEGFKKNLLPEKYLPHYLAFIDHMTDETVLHMVKSACGGKYPENVMSEAQVMFLYGTKANDMAAAKFMEVAGSKDMKERALAMKKSIDDQMSWDKIIEKIESVAACTGSSIAGE